MKLLNCLLWLIVPGLTDQNFSGKLVPRRNFLGEKKAPPLEN